jgi:hypothetical protein
LKIKAIFGFLILVLLILSSPHLYYQNQYRGFFWLALSSIALVLTSLLWNRGSLKINIFFLLLLVVYSYCDFIFRNNISGGFAWLSTVFIFCAINSLNAEELKKSFLMLIILLKILLLIAILYHIANIYNYGLKWNHLIENNLLSNYYGFLIFPFLGIEILKPTAFLNQSSLIPAYICFPFAIYFCIKNKFDFSDYLLFIFITLSFSGSSYFIFFIAVIIFLKPNLFSFRVTKYYIFLALTFFALCGYLFPGGDDPLAKIYLYDSDNYLNERFYSGLMRLNIIGEQFHGLLNRKGAPTNLLISDFGSSLLTAGDRAGILGIILMYFLYRQIFIKLSPLYSPAVFIGLKPNVKFGLCLLASVLFQSIFYNDVGFSLQYGLVMIALTPRLSELINAKICTS